MGGDFPNIINAPGRGSFVPNMFLWNKGGYPGLFVAIELEQGPPKREAKDGGGGEPARHLRFAGEEIVGHGETLPPSLPAENPPPEPAARSLIR